jgi:hypothetical protein
MQNSDQLTSTIVREEDEPRFEMNLVMRHCQLGLQSMGTLLE